MARSTMLHTPLLCSNEYALKFFYILLFGEGHCDPVYVVHCDPMYVVHCDPVYAVHCDPVYVVHCDPVYVVHWSYLCGVWDAEEG